MRTKVIVVAVLSAVLLSAGAAWAEVQYGGYGIVAGEERPFLRAKIGWFEPSEGDLDGDIAFGVDYIIPARQTYLTIDRLHAEDTAVEATTWTIIGGLYRVTPRGYAYGAGIGWSSQELETPSGDKDEDNLAWEIGAGMSVSETGFAEVKYRDGGEDGNTGLVLYFGVTY